jgi:hypothetical protein
VITNDIRGEGEGPITTVLFPDDYLVSGSPNNHRLTAPEIASASPPTTDPGRSGGPIPRPPRPARVGPRPTRVSPCPGAQPGGDRRAASPIKRSEQPGFCGSASKPLDGRHPDGTSWAERASERLYGC